MVVEDGQPVAGGSRGRSVAGRGGGGGVRWSCWDVDAAAATGEAGHSAQSDPAGQVMHQLSRFPLAGGLLVTLYQPLRSQGMLGVHQALANDAAWQGGSWRERREQGPS